MVDSLIPRRAIGATWMPVEETGQRLAVAVEAPESIEPDQTIDVPVQATGQNTGQQVFVTLAAVDDGILQLTRFVAPDPEAYLLAQRRLGVDLRDVYGRLIDPSADSLGILRSGGDAMRGAGLASLPKRSSKVVSLFSGIVETDDNGRAVVSLDIPDFNGRLKLMAVAWTVMGVGSGQADMTVAAPVVADLSLPRFLAPGDRATATLAVDNVSGTDGLYEFTVRAGGAVSVNGTAQQSAQLAAGDKAALGFELIGQTLGVSSIELTITGPGGYLEVRSWDLSVRPPTQSVTNRLTWTTEPGQTSTQKAELAVGFYPESISATLGLNTVPTFDVKGSARCARRLCLCLRGTNHEPGAAPALLPGRRSTGHRRHGREHRDPPRGRRSRAPRARHAARRRHVRLLVVVQRHQHVAVDLCHGLSGKRARERGIYIPDFGYDRGIQALRRAVSERIEEPSVLAYAHYVLARSGNSDLAELDYFA